MAGLSDTGFTVKRLNDIIAELKAKAESEFASLVEPGDIVNTSDTSVLGRFIVVLSTSCRLVGKWHKMYTLLDDINRLWQCP